MHHNMRLFVYILKFSIKSLCRLIVKPIENNDPMPSPNFEFPTFEMEVEDVEDILDDISRLLEHEEKTIQPYFWCPFRKVVGLHCHLERY